MIQVIIGDDIAISPVLGYSPLKYYNNIDLASWGGQTHTETAYRLYLSDHFNGAGPRTDQGNHRRITSSNTLFGPDPTPTVL